MKNTNFSREKIIDCFSFMFPKKKVVASDLVCEEAHFGDVFINVSVADVLYSVGTDRGELSIWVGSTGKNSDQNVWLMFDDLYDYVRENYNISSSLIDFDLGKCGILGKYAEKIIISSEAMENILKSDDLVSIISKIESYKEKKFKNLLSSFSKKKQVKEK